MKPFFSIIVAAYNAEDKITETIQSVLNQSFTDYEIVVKDACSTDRTLQKIPASDRIRVYSEKDRGIYDGMNAGIRYAGGNFLIFLNCGDSFYDREVLQSAYDVICANPSASIAYGDFERDGVVFNQPSTITGFVLYRSTLCHQTLFFHKDVFEKCGLYNTDYQIKADYNTMAAAFAAGMQYVHIPHVICHYEGGGVSEQNRQVNKQEYEAIVHTHFSRASRMKYDFLRFVTLEKLRLFIGSSDKVPVWLKKMYRRAVNSVNRVSRCV